MESDYNTLCNELDNIFLECPTDKSGCAEVQSLIDAFVNKYGKEKPQLRSIISDKLDPHGFNPSISRSCFKGMIMEWIVSFSHEVPVNHCTESSTNVDRDVFEYNSTSYAHSTPLGRFNQRARKIPQKKLSYSPALGFTSDSLENQVSPYHEELKSFRTASKAHNSSLENSLVKAEQKILALEEELKTLKLHSRKDTERLKEEINQLKNFEKLYAGSVNKIEKYAETLNNLTKEYNRLKTSKEDLFKEYTNLEIEHQRLQNDIDAKNISIKALETWKRVQTEELVVLNDSKSLLESEVFKLKSDLKSRTENEESLMMRIGELQSEKQKLQSELNEVISVENLKMVTSSPFRKSLSYEDQRSERSDENRESGISVRSELMDSLGFTSCIDETFHLPYMSVINGTDGVSFSCGATSIDLVDERPETTEQGVQTERIEKKRLQLVETEMQTETIHEQREKARIAKFDRGIQTEVRTRRLSKSEKGVQIELIKERSSNLSQTGVQTISIMKFEKDSQTDDETRDYPENLGVNSFHWSLMDNTLDCLTPTKMDIDSSLEEFHRSVGSFTHRGMRLYNGCDLTLDNSGRPASASSLSVENDSICSSSSDRSIPAYEIIPVLRKPNMSTPRLRIRRFESRRLSCLDIYSKPLSICRSNTYQKLTFSQKISTVFAGIISILSPGVRLPWSESIIYISSSEFDHVHNRFYNCQAFSHNAVGFFSANTRMREEKGKGISIL